MENQEESQQVREPFRFLGENIGALFEALAKAQAEFIEMSRDAAVEFEDKRGGKRQFYYATLAEVLASVRPALNKHGLAILQPFDGERVVTILAFGSSRLEVDAWLPKWNSAQDLGSALTYIKRYQLKSLLGVNDGEDDDGNAASATGKNPEPRERRTATPPPVPPANPNPDSPFEKTKARIRELSKSIGFKAGELETFSVDHGCGKLVELNQPKAEALVKLLEAQQVQP